MKKHIFYWLLSGLVVITGCQKELSFEVGNTPAQGSLQADVTGDCLPKTVNGIYVATTPLVPATNTITIQVNVVRTGTYIITTDTVNGYYFRATGTFTALGAINVTLRSNGTPFAAGVDNFIVSYNGTVCDIQVTVLPAGSGPSVFTLTGAPASCTTPVISGTYAKDVPLSASNTVRLNVNVTTAGSYNVTTTAVNGMTFAGTGTLVTGAQTITLTGSGMPTTIGSNTISVTVGATTCSFVINVVDQVTGTLGGGPGACTPATINGTYFQNIALTAANTVQVQITTSTVGPYSVSTNTVAGFRFSGSGTSTGATQTITLNGTGTPTATGPQNFTITFGTSTCTFTVPVSAGGTFIADCSSAFVNGTYQVLTPLNAGTNTVDIDIDVTALGPFNISTTTTNGMVFSLAGTFTTLGLQTITLVGSGTPLAAGTSNIPMPGTTPCTFPVVCSPAPTIDWKFTVGAITYQGSTLSVDYGVVVAPFSELFYEGDNAANDYFTFDIVDLTGGITNGEVYKADASTFPPENFLFAFYFENAGATVTYESAAGDGTTFRVTVDTHVVATKTITGRFSGTVLDINGATKTISGGTFTAVYP